MRHESFHNPALEVFDVYESVSITRKKNIKQNRESFSFCHTKRSILKASQRYQCQSGSIDVNTFHDFISSASDFSKRNRVKPLIGLQWTPTEWWLLTVKVFLMTVEKIFKTPLKSTPTQSFDFSFYSHGRKKMVKKEFSGREMPTWPRKNCLFGLLFNSFYFWRKEKQKHKNCCIKQSNKWRRKMKNF